MHFAFVNGLKKSALIIQKLALQSEEVQWLTSERLRQPSLSQPGKKILTILDVAELPITETSTTDFERWKQLLALIQLRDILLGRTETISRLLDELADQKADDFQKILADLFELPSTEVQAAVDILTMKWKARYQEPVRLLELIRLLHVLKLMGATLAEVKLLIKAEPDEDSAKTARRLPQAHFSAETLAQRIKPASDQLREKQRDTLVAYLVAEKGLRYAESL